MEDAASSAQLSRRVSMESGFVILLHLFGRRICQRLSLEAAAAAGSGGTSTATRASSPAALLKCFGSKEFNRSLSN